MMESNPKSGKVTASHRITAERKLNSAFGD
jgi:hypothetical protein